MTLTTLPAVLEPVVRQVEDTYKTSYSGQTVKANIHGVILAFLNAALEAGVAREHRIMPSQHYDEQHEIRLNLLGA